MYIYRKFRYHFDSDIIIPSTYDTVNIHPSGLTVPTTVKDLLGANLVFFVFCGRNGPETSTEEQELRISGVKMKSCHRVLTNLTWETSLTTISAQLYISCHSSCSGNQYYIKLGGVMGHAYLRITTLPYTD